MVTVNIWKESICNYLFIFRNHKCFLLLFLLGIAQFVVFCFVYSYRSHASSINNTKLNSSLTMVNYDLICEKSRDVHFLEDISSDWKVKSKNLPPFLIKGSADFQYPLKVDMLDLVHRVKSIKSVSVEPINEGNFPYIIENKHHCELPNVAQVHLLILIKSSIDNFKSRKIIRSTWGRQDCWGGINFRRIFLLGGSLLKNESLLRNIIEEHAEHSDIVQQDFHDHYYNNTYKVMLGLRWATQHCSNALFIMFADDDYFVHPLMTLSYLKSVKSSLYPRLFSGNVVRFQYREQSSKPRRSMTHEEFPHGVYPPYCSGGNFILSMDVAIDLAIAMKYTRYIKLDDVFLGVVLHKLLIAPINIENIFTTSNNNISSKNYWKMISSHGYEDPTKLLKTWTDLNCNALCK